MKNNIKFLLLAGIVALIVSCESKEHSENKGVTIANVRVVNESDPVCDMPTAEHLKDTLTYEGKLYGFCSTNCKEKFKGNPKKFIKEK